MDILVQQHGEAAVFVGDPKRQVAVARQGVKGVYNHSDAKALIEGIVHQGSGGHCSGGRCSIGDLWDKDPYNQEKEHPHYYRFDEIAKGRFYLDKDQPDIPTGAMLDTNFSTVHKFLPNPKALDFVKHPHIHDKMMDFNICYSTMLSDMQNSFNGAPESFAQTFGTMFAISRLARELVTIPVPDNPGFMAHPSWEWVNITDPNLAPCSGLMLSDDPMLLV